jgi:hypothetical protein
LPSGWPETRRYGRRVFRDRGTVFAAQLFETALIPIFELFQMQTMLERLEETGGFVRAGAFKIPIKNRIKSPKEQGQITPDLEVS